MKIKVYAARKDEYPAIEAYSKELGFDISLESRRLTPETALLAEGFDAVTFLGNCQVDRRALTILRDFNIKYIATRSIGYNNVDIDSAKEFGINVSNASYSSNSVSEFVLLSILNILRKIPLSYKKHRINDFSLKGLQGRELRNQTVGIVGTGKIGCTVAQNLTGFGCKILAYDPYPNKDLESIVTYVPLAELLSTSDVITLHVPLLETTKGIINKDTINTMKNRVVIINSARGELIVNEDLINGLKNGKIAGAALDVIDKEQGLYHTDQSLNIVDHEALSVLKSLPNVQLTSHHAFYTEQAVSDMVETAFRNLHSFLECGSAPNQLQF